MLSTEPMRKVRIIALENEMHSIVSELQSMGIIDMRRSKTSIEDCRPMEKASEISELLIRTEGALRLLSSREVKPCRHMDIERLIKEARDPKTVGRIYELGNEKQSIDEDDVLLDYAIKASGMLKGISICYDDTKSGRMEYLAFSTDRKGMSGLMKMLKETHDYEMQTNRQDKEFAGIIAYAKGSPAADAVKEAGVTEIDMHSKYMHGTPEEALRNAGLKKSKNSKRRQEILKELERISVSEYSRLSGIREMLEIEFARANVSGIFKKTDRTFLVEGWIVKKRYEELEIRLSAITSGRYHLETVEDEELAPTHINRPKFLQPFDYLMNFYSTPRSDEIDPTWIFIISFPIFYGLMVSDVGYGLLSLIFVSFIIMKTDPNGLLSNVSRVWRLTSFSAIFFGVLSDQYFGFPLNKYLFNFTAFNWLANITTVLVITIFFGISQVVLGLLFGFVNQYRHGHRKHALAKLASIAAILFGTVAVSAAFFGQFNYTVAEYTGIISILSIFATVGLSREEAPEITNLITHPLSYARIMGFGLGSVIIAMLIDQAFTPNLGNGILPFIVYLIIFIVLHFFNMTLGIFEGMVQGVRLNFVEFFSKFYMGNGVRFRPFWYKRVYTKE